MTTETDNIEQWLYRSFAMMRLEPYAECMVMCPRRFRSMFSKMQNESKSKRRREAVMVPFFTVWCAYMCEFRSRIVAATNAQDTKALAVQLERNLAFLKHPFRPFPGGVAPTLTQPHVVDDFVCVPPDGDDAVPIAQLESLDISGKGKPADA